MIKYRIVEEVYVGDQIRYHIQKRHPFLKLFWVSIIFGNEDATLINSYASLDDAIKALQKYDNMPIHKKIVYTI